MAVLTRWWDTARTSTSWVTYPTRRTPGRSARLFTQSGRRKVRVSEDRVIPEIHPWRLGPIKTGLLEFEGFSVKDQAFSA